MLAVFWQLLKLEDDRNVSSSDLSAGVHVQVATLMAIKLLTRVSKLLFLHLSSSHRKGAIVCIPWHDSAVLMMQIQ